MIFKGLSKSQIVMLPIGAALILLPLFPMPRPASLTGHPWKIELAVFLLLTCALAAVALRKYQPSIPEGLRSIRVPFTLFVVWSATSVIWAGSAWSVFHHTAVWTAYLFSFLFFVSLAATVDGKRFLIASAGFAGFILGAVTLFAYLQVLLNPEFGPTFRVTYAKYSELLAMLVPFFFVLACCVKQNRALAYAAALISFAGVVVSMSKGSLLAVLFGIAVVLALVFVYGLSKPILKRAVVLAIGFIFVFGIAQLGNTSGPNQTTLVSRIRTTTKHQNENDNFRLLVMGVSITMIRSHPLIGIGADNFGIDLNKYRVVYANQYPDSATNSAGEDYLPERSHNEYLQIFAELGIVGILLFVSILLASGFIFVKRMKESGSLGDRALRIGAAAGMMAFLVSSGVSSFSFRAVQNGLVFFVLLAIAIAPRITRSGVVGEHAYAGVIPALLFSLLASALFVSQAIGSFFVMAAERNEKLENAVALYKTAGLFDGSSASADMSLAMRYLNEKKPIEAIPFYRSAIEKGAGTISVYHFLAYSNLISEKPENAESVMRECVSIFPNSVYARVYLAYFLEKNGKTSEAKKQSEAARRLDSKTALTWESIFDKGILNTSIEARNREDMVEVSELSPPGVVTAVLAMEKLYPMSQKVDK